METLGWKAVPDWIADNPETVAEHLFDYLASNVETYLGRYFEPLAAQAARDRFDTYDLAALWSLSVTVNKLGRKQLLHDKAEILSLLIAKCRRTIGDKSRGQLLTDKELDRLTSADSPFVELWHQLNGIESVGTTKSSKLMAAKFPNVVPVWDDQVSQLLSGNGKIWLPMHELLRTGKPAVASLLKSPPTPDRPKHERRTFRKALRRVPVLRRLDIVLWMEAQSRSRPR
jgi:hypothetical protein